MIRYFVVLGVMILCTILLACAAPFFYYLQFILKPTKKEKFYLFPLELLDFDFENSFFNAIQAYNRKDLSDRGGVRKPMGYIMQKDFEENKEQEYKIKLP